MIALLWKDWRLVRPLCIACGVLFITPTIVVLFAALFLGNDGPKNSEDWGRTLSGTSFAGLFLSMLTVPMFAAVMFARERRDRSGEMVATFPISRGRVVLSKSIVSIASALLPWLLAGPSLMLVILVLLGGQLQRASSDVGSTALMMVPAFVSISAFGLAWLFSALWSSETLAAGVALLVTAILASSLALFMYNKDLTNTWGIWQPYAVLLAPLGIASYLAGTVVALRRASP